MSINPLASLVALLRRNVVGTYRHGAGHTNNGYDQDRLRFIAGTETIRIYPGEDHEYPAEERISIPFTERWRKGKTKASGSV